MIEETQTRTAFGLIVVGDEVLNGQRTDKHLAAFKAMLGARGHELAWFWLLPDDPEVLVRQFQASMALGQPVFSCGGIGATPDDHTRACAARAAGVALTRHAEAQRLIEERFGAEAYPKRVLMADLPEGANLIPNPYNQVPGFSIHQHYFLPGFPQMAHPMAEWVLDGQFPNAALMHEQALEVRGTPESGLIDIMEAVGPRFPGLKLFSLPHLGEDRHILLGFRGHEDPSEAMAVLRAALDQAGVQYSERD